MQAKATRNIQAGDQRRPPHALPGERRIESPVVDLVPDSAAGISRVRFPAGASINQRSGNMNCDCVKTIETKLASAPFIVAKAGSDIQVECQATGFVMTDDNGMRSVINIPFRIRGTARRESRSRFEAGQRMAGSGPDRKPDIGRTVGQQGGASRSPREGAAGRARYRAGARIRPPSWCPHQQACRPPGTSSRREAPGAMRARLRGAGIPEPGAGARCSHCAAGSPARASPRPALAQGAASHRGCARRRPGHCGNAGRPGLLEQRREPGSGELDCPACSGSGHVGDLPAGSAP